MISKMPHLFVVALMAVSLAFVGCADTGGSSNNGDATGDGGDTAGDTGGDVGGDTGGDTGGDMGGDSVPDVVAGPDADGDGITDMDEGSTTNLDTDQDGTPDYLDDDSDNDGILDIDEAGDTNPGTPPIDSDSDGSPDFQDLDADGNGIPDADEGTVDTDADGIPDFSDTDNDGDGILDVTELVGEGADCDGDGNADPNGTVAMPRDCDNDGIPDYMTQDSDGDTISDQYEGVATESDMDGFLDRYDDDSDNDGIPDILEAGDTDILTAPIDTDSDGIADFRDPDSDNDGLSDYDENLGGTSPYNADSDMDGVSDLVETAAGTDPTNPNDNPQANGDFVFIVPFMTPPSPDYDDLDFSTDLQIVDVYLLIDRSGSMNTEWDSIRNSISTVASNVTCPPNGTGTPGSCIPDIWWGSGSIGYYQSGGDAYRNIADMQPSPTAISAIGARVEPSSCCEEPIYFATWASVTGQGGSAAGCSNVTAVPNRSTCNGSPAGAGGLGYPCFRPTALPVILLATDEPPAQTYNCPTSNTVVAAANTLGAKIIGIQGGSGGSTQTQLEALASGTGAVDSMGSPIVLNGTNANAAQAIEDGIRQLANGVRLDLVPVAIDDPSDSVDAVTEFIDHLETLQLGTPLCSNGLTDRDSNGDMLPDEYVQVVTGTPVCWRLFPKQNNTVMPTDEPQLFEATIQVLGDGFTPLDDRQVYFLVPPMGIEIN